MKKITKNKVKELFRCNIAGVQYSDYQLCLGLKAGLSLKLFWEPSNAFDSRAIRVEYNGVKLGYIPRGEFQNNAHYMHDNGYKLFTTLVSVNKNNPSWNMFVIKVETKDKSKKKETEL